MASASRRAAGRKAVQKLPRGTVTKAALSRQAKRAARERGPADLSRAAQRAARTRAQGLR
jgi:hypothetical protein